MFEALYSHNLSSVYAVFASLVSESSSQGRYRVLQAQDDPKVSAFHVITCSRV